VRHPSTRIILSIKLRSGENSFDVTMPNNMKPKTIAAVNAVRDHCRPKDATIGKAVDMLCKAIADHPTQGDLSGAALLLDIAINLAWPCN
jgi:hypothetical protein